MNASKFMDKQIMDLSRSNTADLLNPATSKSKSSSDFLDLMNPQSEEDSHPNPRSSLSSSLNSASNKDEILASYDFHPIPRPGGGVGAGVSSSVAAGDAAAPAPAATGSSPRANARAWNSVDSKPNSAAIRSYSSVDPVEPEKVVTEKAQKLNESAIVSEIDFTMKKYADSVLHAIDGLSVRLSQLESRTSRLEYAMDDLKVCIGNNHGSADGKMRQLENMLLEVQSGVQDIKDKQDVMEGKMQLAQLQHSKAEKSSETPNTAHVEPPAPQLPVSAPPPPAQQSQQLQQYPMPASQPVPALPPNVLPPPQQNIQPPPPMTSQFPPTQVPPVHVPQRDSYFPPPQGQTQEPPLPSQQYQAPPPGQQIPGPTPPPPQPQQYQPAPTGPYPQPPPPSQPQHPPVVPANAPPQFQPPMSHQPEENPYIPPSQSYPANPRQQPMSQPSSVPHSQPYYGNPAPMYDAAPPPPGRSGSGFSSGYGPPSGPPSEPYPYSSPPSHYGSGSSMKPQPHSPSGGSGNYPKLPTAKILPQAIPTATGISDAPSSGGGGNRVPIDDVIDKVTSMGFPREHVRATVRRLTENGQSVDLNVVLDKLMNDGDVQPPRGWFGR